MQEILTFWFRKHGYKDWFKQDPNFDSLIRSKFTKIWKLKSKQEVNYKQKAKDLLGEIILFDQFSRNMFRGTPDAYSRDKRALSISKYILKRGLDEDFTKDEKVFLYMPFMHSENLKDQERSVKLFKSLNYFDYLKYAQGHYEEIKRFGKFQTREKVKNGVREIEIIGFGFSGLSVFIKYIDYCIKNGLRNTKVTIYSKGKHIKGEAYSTTFKTDLLNVVKTNMEIANDLNMRFDEWNGIDERLFLPRMQFGKYLEHLYSHYLKLAKQIGVEVVFKKNEKKKLSKIELKDKKVFLCLGSKKKKEILKFKKVKSPNILILGTGLSAIDKLIQLSTTKFKHITLYSRSGVFPKVSKPYEKLDLKYLTKEYLENKKVNLDVLYKALLSELSKYVENPVEYVDKQFNSKKTLDFDTNHLELILKSIDLDLIKDLWIKLSLKHKKELISKYFSFWQKVTSPFPSENANIIQKMLDTGVVSITTKQPNFNNYDCIYNCTGYLRNSDGLLVNNMHKQKLVSLNSFGGLDSKNNNIFIIGDLSFGSKLFLNTAKYIDAQVGDIFRFL